MEAVMEAIEVELRAVAAQRQALKAKYDEEERRLAERQEALERARDILREHAGAPPPPPPRRFGRAVRHGESDAEAVENLYPSRGSRVPEGE